MTPSQLIDQQIANTSDWRGKLMAKLRALIHEADPKVVEDWKWETGIWSHNGMVCAVSPFKDHVKINFFKGAQLNDPKKLFNSGLDSKKHRSINFAPADVVSDQDIKEFVRAAVLLNSK